MDVCVGFLTSVLLVETFVFCFVVLCLFCCFFVCCFGILIEKSL